MTATLGKLWTKLGALKGKGAIISGATGAEPVTSEERAFLGEHPDFAVRATGTMFGHTMQTQVPLGIGLAALSISRGVLFPPTIRPGWRLKWRPHRPRLWWWVPVIGGAKAWPWSKRSVEHRAGGET